MYGVGVRGVGSGLDARALYARIPPQGREHSYSLRELAKRALSGPKESISTRALRFRLYFVSFLLTVICAGGVQADEVTGKLVGDDLSSAIVRKGGHLFEARPDTVSISGCDVRIEYIYADSCRISGKVANKIIEFQLNEISEIDLIEGTDRTHFAFLYRTEIAEFARDAEALVRKVRRENSTRNADDIDLARHATEQFEAFYATRSPNLRSTVTYCNGASVPSFYPTTDAHLFIDSTRASALADRLRDYMETFCPMDQEG